MPIYDLSTSSGFIEKRRSVTLVVTHKCNLRCLYCYEHEKTDKNMSFEIATKSIEKYMLMEDGHNAVVFEFFGGEPLLAFPLIVDTVEWFHKRNWTKNHLFFITTNGTLLTDEIKNWLITNKHCVKAGISLDGNKQAHDINRCNSYDTVINNIPFFLENYPDQPVKMTISAESIPYVADSIIDLEEKRIPFTANIVFENIWGN